MFAHVQQDSGYATFDQNMAETRDYVPQIQNAQQQIPIQQAYVPNHSYITPVMWREAVASASNAGIKRTRGNAPQGPSSGITKRPR